MTTDQNLPIPKISTEIIDGEPVDLINAAAIRYLAWATDTEQARQLRKLIALREAELREKNPLLTAATVVDRAVVAALQDAGCQLVTHD